MRGRPFRTVHRCILRNYHSIVFTLCTAGILYHHWQLDFGPTTFVATATPPALDPTLDIQNLVESEPSTDKEMAEETDSCDWKGDPENENDMFPGFCELLMDVKGVGSYIECRRACCESKDCRAWQYREDIGCRFSTPEHHGWCEPTAPSPWTGRHLEKRDSSSGECFWKPKVQRSQCKGLGPRRPKGGPYWTTPEECQRDCCKDPNCQLWQFREDKGCFWGKANYCDNDQGSHAFEPFKGGAKVHT
mmetsp:Transcript_13676/g.33453  ORF Transcript_13676/g.33453 Transcript_13676/m.33453 type:complete len:247 (+) Transcript_13676:209-949(+)